MNTGNGQSGEWVNLYGSDGKVKARLNRHTLELVVKERGCYHSWRLASMVERTQNTSGAPVESAPVSC
jgi:hypothetical protein